MNCKLLIWSARRAALAASRVARSDDAPLINCETTTIASKTTPTRIARHFCCRPAGSNSSMGLPSGSAI